MVSGFGHDPELTSLIGLNMSDEMSRFRDALEVFINTCNPKAKQIFYNLWVRNPPMTLERAAADLQPPQKPELVASHERSVLDRLKIFMDNRSLTDALATWMFEVRKLKPREMVPEPIPVRPTNQDPVVISGPGTSVRRITWDGLSLTVKEWAERLGMPHQILNQRLSNLPLEKAMKTPYKPRSRGLKEVTTPELVRKAPAPPTLSDRLSFLLGEGEKLRKELLERRDAVTKAKQDQEIEHRRVMDEYELELMDIETSLSCIPTPMKQERVASNG